MTPLACTALPFAGDVGGAVKRPLSLPGRESPLPLRARRAPARRGRVGRDDVPLAALLLALEQALFLERLEQPQERREPVLALVEVGLLAHQRLFDERG